MVASSSERREFRITVPEKNIVAVSQETWDRMWDLVPDDCATLTWWEEPTEYARTVVGSAPPTLITLLMALAQGHPLEPICDRLEALQ